MELAFRFFGGRNRLVATGVKTLNAKSGCFQETFRHQTDLDTPLNEPYRCPQFDRKDAQLGEGLEVTGSVESLTRSFKLASV